MPATQQWRFKGAACAERWDSSKPYNTDAYPLLQADGGRDFVILNITDIHYSDADVRLLMSIPAQRTIRRIIRTVKPDLITVTGDIVCGKYTHGSIKRFTRFMESFNTPWAPVFGNHDDNGDCDLNYLADAMMSGRHCLMAKGDASLGVGNYIVNIGRGGHVVHSLIMAHTHTTHLNAAQIAWYEWAARGVQAPSTVFFHIPCVQYQYACDEQWDATARIWSQSSASGEVNEKICCHRTKDGVPLDNGFFDRVLSVGTTKNIICGHEHMNNFSAVYKGIRLTYTMKVGKGSGYQPGFNGASVITVNDTGVSSITHVFDNAGKLTVQAAAGQAYSLNKKS